MVGTFPWLQLSSQPLPHGDPVPKGLHTIKVSHPHILCGWMSPAQHAKSTPRNIGAGGTGRHITPACLTSALLSLANNLGGILVTPRAGISTS